VANPVAKLLTSLLGFSGVTKPPMIRISTLQVLDVWAAVVAPVVVAVAVAVAVVFSAAVLFRPFHKKVLGTRRDNDPRDVDE
jgi:hypothetical protein